MDRTEFRKFLENLGIPISNSSWDGFLYYCKTGEVLVPEYIRNEVRSSSAYTFDELLSARTLL